MVNKSLVATVISICIAGSAHACDRYELNGKIKLRQSNEMLVTTELTQTGTKLTGTAIYESYSGAFANIMAVGGGRIAGTVDKNVVQFRIYWKEEVWVYAGSAKPDGTVEGQLYNFDKPAVRINWFTESPAKCIFTNVPSVPSAGELKAMGKGPGSYHPTPKDKATLP
jgi:hypothetical protein